MDWSIFCDVRFFVIQCDEKELVDKLKSSGAVQHPLLSESVRFAISNDPSLTEVGEAEELYAVPVVMPKWIYLSAEAGQFLPFKPFHPDFKHLFSHLTFTLSELSLNDRLALWSVLTIHGAKVQHFLDCNVTHVICGRASGRFYNICKSESSDTSPVLVSPDWVVDSLAKNELQSCDSYHPDLLKRPPSPRKPVFKPQVTSPSLPDSGSQSTGKGPQEVHPTTLLPPPSLQRPPRSLHPVSGVQPQVAVKQTGVHALQNTNVSTSLSAPGTNLRAAIGISVQDICMKSAEHQQTYGAVHSEKPTRGAHSRSGTGRGGCKKGTLQDQLRLQQQLNKSAPIGLPNQPRYAAPQGSVQCFPTACPFVPSTQQRFVATVHGILEPNVNAVGMISVPGTNVLGGIENSSSMTTPSHGTVLVGPPGHHGAHVSGNASTTSGSHHGKSSKSKSSKHAQEQNLNEEEKDAIVIQYVKNILNSQNKSVRENTQGKSSASSSSSEVGSGGTPSTVGSSVSGHGANIHLGMGQNAQLCIMGTSNMTGVTGPGTPRKPKSPRSPGRAALNVSGGVKSSPKSPKGGRATSMGKLLSSQQQHPPSASILMASGPGSATMPSVLLTSNLPHIAGRQPTNTVSSLSIQQLQRPASVQHFITTGGLPHQQQHLVSAAPAYIVQRHPAGQLLTNVPRQTAPQPQMHTQLAVNQAACASQQLQSSSQRHFTQGQSSQATLYLRPTRPPYQSETGELIVDPATVGSDTNPELASVLLAAGSQLGQPQQQHAVYPHSQAPNQVQQQQHTTQQVLLQSSPSTSQLIQFRASHIAHPTAQQHPQFSEVGGNGGGSTYTLAQVSGMGFVNRVQQPQHSQQAPSVISAQPTPHSVTNALYNASKPGSHAPSHAMDRTSPIVTRSPQTPQPYLPQAQQQQQQPSQNHSQQYITSQQPKMHLTVPTGQQYHSVQGYLQAQSQPQQIIFQSPTGQKLIAHHQPVTAAISRGSIAQSSLSPGGVLLRSVGPNSVVADATTVCNVVSMQSHVASLSGSGLANPPAQLLNGNAGGRGNVVYQPNHASVLGPGIVQQLSHVAVGQQPQSYGHVAKQSQLPVHQPPLRPTPSSPVGNVLCPNPNVSPYHPGPVAATNSLTPNHISSQTHGSSVRPGYLPGHHSGQPIHNRVTHVPAATHAQQTPRHGPCHPIASSTVTAPTPSIAPLPPTYYGHEGTPKPTRPEECLIGCVFLLLGYRAAGEAQRALWRRIIRSYGAEVVLTYDPTRVTHLIIDCQLEEPNIVTQALRDRVRIVTIFWVNDVLAKGRMLPPYEIQHLPSPFSADITFSFIKSQIVSLTGFEGKDRLKVEFLIRQLGATYTDYLEPLNTLLVCKRPEGKKYEMAQQWSIPCVNVRWLQDIYFGDLMSLALDLPHKYLSFEPSDVTIALDRCTPRVQDLMVGWQVPIKLNHDAWTRLSKLSREFAIEERERKRKLEMEVVNHPKPKRLKSSLTPLSGDDIKLATNCRTRFETLTNEIKEQDKLRATLKERLKQIMFTDELCTAQLPEVLSLVRGEPVPRHSLDEEDAQQSCLAMLSDSSQEPADPQGLIKTESSIPTFCQTSQTTIQSIVSTPIIVCKDKGDPPVANLTEICSDSQQTLSAELPLKPSPSVPQSSSHAHTNNFYPEQPALFNRAEEQTPVILEPMCPQFSLKIENTHLPIESQDVANTPDTHPAASHQPSLSVYQHPSRPESTPSFPQFTAPIARKRFASGDLDHVDLKRRTTTDDSTSQRELLDAPLPHFGNDLESGVLVQRLKSSPKTSSALESSHFEPILNVTPAKPSQLTKQVINTSVRITFTAIDYESRLSLMELCMQLPNCELVESASDATHLVCNRLLRTPKTYMAIALGLYLVTPKWIQASVVRGVWLDETPWLLSDPEAEMQLGVNLSESMFRSRRRRMLGPQAGLFAGLEFWLSPGACHREVCITLIKACGGTLRHKRPTQKMALLPRPRQLIICHEDDSHVANYLMRIKTGNKAVHHEEFVLSGVLRQELDYESYQIQYVTTLQTNLRAAVAAAEAALANSGSSPMTCAVTTTIPTKSERCSLSRGAINSSIRSASVESKIPSELGVSSASTVAQFTSQTSQCIRSSVIQTKQRANSSDALHSHTKLVESRINSIVSKPSIIHPATTSDLQHLLDDPPEDSLMSPNFYPLPYHPQASRDSVSMRERSVSDTSLPDNVKPPTDLLDVPHMAVTIPSSAYVIGSSAAVPVSPVNPYYLTTCSTSRFSHDYTIAAPSLSSDLQRPNVNRSRQSSVIMGGASSHHNAQYTSSHRQVTALTAMIVAAESGSTDLSASVALTNSDVSSFVLPKSGGGFRGQAASVTSGTSTLNARSAAADAHAVATATAAAANALIHSERKVGVGITELGTSSHSTRSPRTSLATSLFVADFGDVDPRPVTAPPTSAVLTSFPCVSSLDAVKNLITSQLNFQLPDLASEMPDFISSHHLTTFSAESSTLIPVSSFARERTTTSQTSSPNVCVSDLLLNELPQSIHETATSCDTSIHHGQPYFGMSLNVESGSDPTFLGTNHGPNSTQDSFVLPQLPVTSMAYQTCTVPPEDELSSNTAMQLSRESPQPDNN